MPPRSSTLGALALTLWLAPLPASAEPSDSDLVDRLDALESEISEVRAQLGATAGAQATIDSDQGELLQRLAALEGEVALVRRQLEVKLEEDETRASRAALVTADRNGFQITSPDRTSYRLRLRGMLQVDGRIFLEQSSPTSTDTFLLRRARIVFEGTLFDYIDFRIMPEFAGSTPTLQDGYVNLRYWQPLQIEAGQFKSPFGLERLQSAAALTFIERGFPTQLAPNRDLGVMLHGDFREGVLTYQLAAVDGVTDGSSATTDSDDSKDVVARVFAQPFLETTWAPLQGIGFGLAGTYGEQTRATTVYRTSGQEIFFRYANGVSEAGPRLRLAPQATWYWGPFGSMLEWTRSETTVSNTAGTRFESEVTAWQVAASWVLTGEAAGFRGVIPRSPFRPSECSWGAFEIAGRYHRLEVADAVFAAGFASWTVSASRADAWTVGLNWILNPFVKLLVNFERTEFLGGGATPGTNRPDEDLFVVRTQLAY